MRYARCLVLTLLALTALPALLHADPAYVLFNSYTFSMPRAEIAKLPGATEGEGSFAGDLMLPEAQFAGLPWNVRFEFAGDKLVRVSLMEGYTRERMDKVTAALRGDHYEMLGLLVDSKRLDVLGLLKTAGSDATRERIREMLDNGPRRVIYAWFQTTEVSHDMKMMSRDLSELLMAAPAGMREAEVTVLAEESTKRPALLLVDFSFPVLMAQPAR